MFRRKMVKRGAAYGNKTDSKRKKAAVPDPGTHQSRIVYYFVGKAQSRKYIDQQQGVIYDPLPGVTNSCEPTRPSVEATGPEPE